MLKVADKDNWAALGRGAMKGLTYVYIWSHWQQCKANIAHMLADRYTYIKPIDMISDNLRLFYS